MRRYESPRMGGPLMCRSPFRQYEMPQTVSSARPIVRDITARKHAEDNLRKSEERFRSSLLHSPLPVLLFDDREQIVALSQSWLEETGYSREELRRIEDWTARAYGERSGAVLKHIRRIISTEPEAQRA